MIRLQCPAKQSGWHTAPALPVSSASRFSRAISTWRMLNSPNTAYSNRRSICRRTFAHRKKKAEGTVFGRLNAFTSYHHWHQCDSGWLEIREGPAYQDGDVRRLGLNAFQGDGRVHVKQNGEVNHRAGVAVSPAPPRTHTGASSVWPESA